MLMENIFSLFGSEMNKVLLQSYFCLRTYLFLVWCELEVFYHKTVIWYKPSKYVSFEIIVIPNNFTKPPISTWWARNIGHQVRSYLKIDIKIEKKILLQKGFHSIVALTILIVHNFFVKLANVQTTPKTNHK